MTQAILLGLLAGVLALFVMVLVLAGFDNSNATTALTGAISMIVGVLVTGWRAGTTGITGPTPPSDDTDTGRAG